MTYQYGTINVHIDFVQPNMLKLGGVVEEVHELLPVHSMRKKKKKKKKKKMMIKKKKK